MGVETRAELLAQLEARGRELLAQLEATRRGLDDLRARRITGETPASDG